MLRHKDRIGGRRESFSSSVSRRPSLRPSVDPTSFPTRSAVVVVVIDGSISFPPSVTDLHEADLK